MLTYRFVVRTGTPTAEQERTIEAGTKLSRGCKFRCFLSDEPIPEAHIKAEGPAERLNEVLLAVVAAGTRGRVYLSPETVPQVSVERPTDLRGIDAPLANDPRNLWCLGYGLNTFDKLFTARQLVALTTFSDLVMEARERVLADARTAYADPSPERQRVDSVGSEQPSPDLQGAVAVTTPAAIPPVADARGSVTPASVPSAPGSTYHAPDGPGAYFITFTTYGTWLPGDERTFVDREHNRPDEPCTTLPLAGRSRTRG